MERYLTSVNFLEFKDCNLSFFPFIREINCIQNKDITGNQTFSFHETTKNWWTFARMFQIQSSIWHNEKPTMWHYLFQKRRLTIILIAQLSQHSFQLNSYWISCPSLSPVFLSFNSITMLLNLYPDPHLCWRLFLVYWWRNLTFGQFNNYFVLQRKSFISIYTRDKHKLAFWLLPAIVVKQKNGECY